MVPFQPWAGDVHPVRRAIVRAIPKRVAHARVPDLPPALFWRVVQAAPEYVRAAYVTLAATGLRVGEYLVLTRDHLLPHMCSVNVPGTKTAGSAAVLRVDARLWPGVLAAVPAPVRYKWLRVHWKRALVAAEAALDLRLHDLRHCTGQARGRGTARGERTADPTPREPGDDAAVRGPTGPGRGRPNDRERAAAENRTSPTILSHGGPWASTER